MTDTKTPVEELSGRELDAAVAEKVLGYPPLEVVRPAYPGHGGGWENPVIGWLADPGVGEECKRTCATHPEDVAGVKFYVPPSYSTDIAAAWEVVERLDGFIVMRVDAYQPPEWMTDTSPQAAGWWAVAGQDGHTGYVETSAMVPREFGPVQAEFGVVGWFAKAAPEAICRAALEYVRSRDT